MPVSVKFDPETRSRLKALAELLAKSENQLINESVATVLRMVWDRRARFETPTVVAMADAVRAMDDKTPEAERDEIVAWAVLAQDLVSRKDDLISRLPGVVKQMKSIRSERSA